MMYHQWDARVWKELFLSIIRSTKDVDEDENDVLAGAIILGHKRATLLRRNFEPGTDVLTFYLYFVFGLLSRQFLKVIMRAWCRLERIFLEVLIFTRISLL